MSKSLITDTQNLLYRIYHINRPDEETVKRYVQLMDDNSLTLPSEIIDELQHPILSTFFRALRSYVRDFEPDDIYAVWDRKLERSSTNFRKEAKHVQYKAQRDYTEVKLMHAFDDIIDRLIHALGIKKLNPRVMEGDDVIAWLAHNLPGSKVIVSVDQDFLQLVNDQTAIYSPIKKVTITTQNLIDHTKVRPDCFVLYKAIKGDAGDNIPGLAGFGSVRAKKLCENWEEFHTKLTTEQLLTVNENVKLVDLSLGYKFYPEERESYQAQLIAQENLEPDLKLFRELASEYRLTDITNNFSTWVAPFRSNNPMVDSITALTRRLGLGV